MTPLKGIKIIDIAEINTFPHSLYYIPFKVIIIIKMIFICTIIPKRVAFGLQNITEVQASLDAYLIRHKPLTPLKCCVLCAEKENLCIHLCKE
jgi:hypothetical protein